ncbi:MAG: DUF2279 domain-containing protein [Spirochaetes bacterium]|nr:DUF2279 domain-containing protein [Spirochaetota bacterium]
MRKKAIITMILTAMAVLAAATGPFFSFNPGAGGTAYAEEKTGKTETESPGTKLPARWDNKITRDVIRYLYSVGFPTATLSYALYTGGGPKRDYWKWSHDGFFGHGTPYGGFDKAIKMFTHYSAMRLSCAVFNYTERGSPYRFLYSTLLTSLMGLSMEIVDAYMGSGFSYQDLVFDYAGILLGCFLSAFPKVDAFLSLSVEYWPSKFFREHPDRLLLLRNDYDGMIIMANIKLAGFREVGVNIPNFLRYIMIDIGYGVRGYTSYDRRAAWDNYSYPMRSQNLYVGISINFMEVVKDLFRDPQSLGCRATQQIFKLYHVPAGYKHRVVLKESLNAPRSYSALLGGS